MNTAGVWIQPQTPFQVVFRIASRTAHEQDVIKENVLRDVGSASARPDAIRLSQEELAVTECGFSILVDRDLDGLDVMAKPTFTLVNSRRVWSSDFKNSAASMSEKCCGDSLAPLPSS